MLEFEIPRHAVEDALHFAKTKMQLVGAGGGHWTIISTEHKSKVERQYTGMLGEMAFSIAVLGEERGIRRFRKDRLAMDATPNSHDKGHDVFMYLDVKTRRLEERTLQYLGGDILNYEVILRPKHIYPNAKNPHLYHRYAHVVVKYGDELFEDKITPVTAYVFGWAPFSKMKHYPNGKPGLQGELWSLSGREMLPLNSFQKNFIPPLKFLRTAL